MAADPVAKPVRRILMTADTVGGVWTYALELVEALGVYGIEIALATMGKRLSPEQCRAVSQIDHLELYESSYKLEWMDDPWADVAEAGGWLLDLAGQLQPDLVHLNGYAHATLPWAVPVLVVGHSCVLSWWQAVRGELAPDTWAIYHDAVRKGLEAADLVIAPTQAMRAALERHYSPLPNSQVIPNGRDPRQFKPADKEPFVLAVGRLWDEAKNIQVLEQIAPSLAWPVYVAGENSHPDRPNSGQTYYEAMHYLGKLDPPHVADWLSRAAIYALPACYEPFGLSVLEAALSGCALVLGDIPSLRENWNGAALFVPPNDKEAWQNTLQRLIDDPALRDQLGCFARERGACFTPQRMALNYRAAYRSVMS